MMKKDENSLGLDLDYLATTSLDLLNLNSFGLIEIEQMSFVNE
jgi:hypothetical protein